MKKEEAKFFDKIKPKLNIKKALNDLKIGNISKYMKKEEKLGEFADTILINDKNEILILKRAKNETDKFSGLWCLPGGHIDIEEQPQQAAIRELLEETNIDLQYQHFSFKLYEILELGEKTIFYYKYKIIPEENQLIENIIINNVEHSNYCWASKLWIETYDFIGDLKQTLLKILDKI